MHTLSLLCSFTFAHVPVSCNLKEIFACSWKTLQQPPYSPLPFKSSFLIEKRPMTYPPLSPCPHRWFFLQTMNWHDYAHLASTCQMRERLYLFHSPTYCPFSGAVREMLGKIKAPSWEAGSYPRFQMCLCMPHLSHSYSIFKTPA